MKKQVNPAVLWVCRLIFEHLMTLRTMNEELYATAFEGFFDLEVIN
jgi:hypothetical protein